MAEQLETFVATALSTRGAGVVHVIKQALQASNVFVFGELLELESVIEVCEVMGFFVRAPCAGDMCRWVYGGITKSNHMTYVIAQLVPHGPFVPQTFENAYRNLSLFPISYRRTPTMLNTRSGTTSYAFLRTVLCMTITVWCRSRQKFQNIAMQTSSLAPRVLQCACRINERISFVAFVFATQPAF